MGEQRFLSAIPTHNFRDRRGVLLSYLPRLTEVRRQAVEFVGMPEARIPLAHATAYMCHAPKSREAYDSLNAATEKIEAEQTKAVPEHLKNKHFPVNPEN